MRGGASGSRKGPGYVYVFKDRYEEQTIFKIGQAEDVKVRLKQIQRQKGHEKTEQLAKFKATEANGAETEAHDAVKKNLGMVKATDFGSATDWFFKKSGVSHKRVLDEVKAAVKRHNKRIE